VQYEYLVLSSCRTSKGQTALHLSLKYGYTDVAELLLEKVKYIYLHTLIHAHTHVLIHAYLYTYMHA
jgi:ankyrin repeat protein